MPIMQDIKNSKVFVVEGGMVGRLSIGPLVFKVREHPLFVETPVSYVQQGRLRECTCTCGNVKLIAERVLEQGRIQSCGCLRAERGRLFRLKKETSQLNTEQRKALTREIKSEQKRLKYYQAQTPKDEERISQIGARIRELMLQRMSTVNYKRNAQERSARRERKLMAGLEESMSKESCPDDPQSKTLNATLD